MSPDPPPGRLIGTGRSADVYSLDAGRVLRRYRRGSGARGLDATAEASLMRFLRDAGYPVPEVFDADGPDLVMERLSGHDMLADLTRRPWRAGRHATTLARLHDRLHAIAAPAGLRRPFDSQNLDRHNKVLHLDLHPGNVMLTRRGPMVIDWSSAGAGPPGADAAIASLIMTVSEIDSLPAPVRLIAGQVRAAVVRAFEAQVNCDFRPYLAAAASVRMRDPNVRPGEIDQLRRIADAASR